MATRRAAASSSSPLSAVGIFSPAPSRTYAPSSSLADARSTKASEKLSLVTAADVAGDMDPPSAASLPLPPSSGNSSSMLPRSSSSSSVSTLSRPDLMRPLSVDRRHRSERRAAKMRLWKEGPYAAGLVEQTWKDELGRCSNKRWGSVDEADDDDDDDDANGPHKGCCSDACSEDMEPTCCCLQLSGLVCSRIGAGRVGNMAVLREVEVQDEGGEYEDDDDDEKEEEEGTNDFRGGGGRRQRRTQPPRTRIDCIVGPYWPMLFCVTYPLVLGVSLWTGLVAVAGKPLVFQVVWAVLTSGLIYSLFSVSCRDPGILRRHRRPPSPLAARGGDGGGGGGEWRWNDQAQSYRPRGAVYDSDCAVVIEEFDHTCPWTGTGIGKKNMAAFQAFVALVFVCLIMDILTLTGAFG